MKYIFKGKHNKAQAGMGLIEVLIAVMTTALMLTAVAILMTMSIKNSAEARYREVANSRSQDVIEFFKRKRATEGWETFWNYVNVRGGTFDTFCVNTDEDFRGEDPQDWLPDGQNLNSCVYEYDDALKADFKRTLTVTDISSTGLKISVESFWKVGTTPRSVVLEQEFTLYQ